MLFGCHVGCYAVSLFHCYIVRLVSWTKTFNCPGVVGENAVRLLQEAIDKRGDLNVNVIAILNDTTGRIRMFVK